MKTMATAPPAGMSNADVDQLVPPFVSTGDSAPPVTIRTARPWICSRPGGSVSPMTVSNAVVVPLFDTSTRKATLSPASSPTAGPVMVLLRASRGSPTVSMVSETCDVGRPVPGSSKKNVAWFIRTWPSWFVSTLATMAV